jgi:hypothetical protein
MTLIDQEVGTWLERLHLPTRRSQRDIVRHRSGETNHRTVSSWA